MCFYVYVYVYPLEGTPVLKYVEVLIPVLNCILRRTFVRGLNQSTQYYITLFLIDKLNTFLLAIKFRCRSQWARGLKRRSAAARLLRSWVRIPPGAWMFVCCECCVLSGRGLCDELITRPEESYRLWCAVVCDLENLKNEEAMGPCGSQRHRKKMDDILLHFVEQCFRAMVNRDCEPSIRNPFTCCRA